MIKINGSGIVTDPWIVDVYGINVGKYTIQSWILWAWWEKPSKPGWNSLFESQKLSSLTHGSIGRTAGFGDHSESLIIKKIRNKTWKSDCWLTLHLGIYPASYQSTWNTLWFHVFTQFLTDFWAVPPIWKPALEELHRPLQLPVGARSLTCQEWRNKGPRRLLEFATKTNSRFKMV